MVMLPDLVRDFRARRKFDVNNYIVNKDGAGAYRESHFREMIFLGKALWGKGFLMYKYGYVTRPSSGFLNPTTIRFVEYERL